MRRTKECDEHLIEHSAIITDKVSENGSSRFALSKRRSLYRAEVMISDADGLGAADADDADGSTLSSSDSTNSV